MAESEKELGLDISDDAISQMKAHLTLTDQDFEVAAIEEKKRRHDGQQSKTISSRTQFVDIPG